MPDTKQNLRAVHANACAAVMRADRTLTPEVDAFWPIYLRAVLAAPPSCVTTIEVISDIETERSAQVRQWGGAVHDDKLFADDWAQLIEKQIHSIDFDSVDSIRSRYVKIAALAIAAIESLHRRVNGSEA